MISTMQGTFEVRGHNDVWFVPYIGEPVYLGLETENILSRLLHGSEWDYDNGYSDGYRDGFDDGLLAVN